jgi:hypothetical protein
MSPKLMWFMFLEYMFLAGWFCAAKSWWLMMYWIGACVIQFAVMKGMG